MAILEKRVLLGVQNKKVPNKPNKKITKKKHVLEKVVDYLKSDTYLFAPLTRRSNYRSLKGVQLIKRDHKESKKSLVKKVGDYLVSDSYMYSSLLVVPSKSFNIPPTEAQLHIKRVTNTMETTRRSISLKEDKKMANGIAGKGQPNKDCVVAKERKSLVHMETVNHAVHQNCWPSVSGKGTVDSQKRKFFFDTHGHLKNQC